MSNYSEADVERRHQQVLKALRTSGPNWSRSTGDVESALAHLRNAALEGAKVPGLERELEDTRAAWHRETERADALQGRVAELERELEPKVKSTTSCHHVRGSSGGACSACFERAMNRLDAARSERDALRAQVAPMREALEWIERETHPEDGLTFERIHAKAAAALSALSAETKGVKS